MLSTDLWMQWLEDEEQLADSQETLHDVLRLYDRAVSDYLCNILFINAGLITAINIWSRYLDFVENNRQSLADVLGLDTNQFLEMCFKKATAATQYHIPEVCFLAKASVLMEPESEDMDS